MRWRQRQRKLLASRIAQVMHPAISRRLIHATTRGPENGGQPWQSLVLGPFTGGGSSAVAAHETQRRFTGGDVNPAAPSFSADRMMSASH